MTGSRQQKPRIGLTKCPDLVDHYKWHLLTSEAVTCAGQASEIIGYYERR